MFRVNLKKDEAKIIDYAIKLAYACGDWSPVLKPCDHNHPNFEARLEKDWDAAADILLKLGRVQHEER